MKTTNVTAQKIGTIYPSYFVGSTIHDLMVKTTHMLMTDSCFGEPNKIKLEITPVHHPELFKIDWVFKILKKKICSIRFEEDEHDNGEKYNRCYLIWHDHTDVHFVDLYKRTFGLPEKVKTKRDVDNFFRFA